MALRHCPNCKRNVETERSYSLALAVILILFLFPIGVIYLIWGIHKGRRCPICKVQENYLEAPRPDEE